MGWINANFRGIFLYHSHRDAFGTRHQDTKFSQRKFICNNPPLLRGTPLSKRGDSNSLLAMTKEKGKQEREE
jgi:hypothetical protein